MKNAHAKKSNAQRLEKVVDQLKTARGPQRREALAKAVTLAGNTQEGRSYAYELARLGINSEAQASAILAASEPAVRNAQRARPWPLSPAVGRFGRSQEGALRDVFSGNYRPETLPRTSTELPSQTRQTRESERAIAAAEDAEIEKMTAALDEALSSTAASAMQRVAEISYRLSKAKLYAAHRRGEA